MIKVMRFTAPWCAPCRMVSPIFKQMQSEMTDIEFETVDVEENPEMAMEYSVRSVPTVIVFKDGVDMVSFSGAASKKQYMDMIEDVRNA